MILTEFSLSKKKEKKENADVNWCEHSDNYMSATAPNGHTVLASRSAGGLFIRSLVKNKKNKEKKKR